MSHGASGGSPVWRFFRRHPRGQAAICMMCGVELQQGASTTTCLWKHLKSRHPEEYHTLQREKRAMEEDALQNNLINIEINSAEQEDVKPDVDDPTSPLLLELTSPLTEAQLYTDYTEVMKQKLFKVFTFFDDYIDLLFSVGGRSKYTGPDARLKTWQQFSNVCLEQGLIPAQWNELQIKKFFLVRKKDYVIGRHRLRKRQMPLPLADWERVFLNSLGMKTSRFDTKKSKESTVPNTVLPQFLLDDSPFPPKENGNNYSTLPSTSSFQDSTMSLLFNEETTKHSSSDCVDLVTPSASPPPPSLSDALLFHPLNLNSKYGFDSIQQTENGKCNAESPQPDARVIDYLNRLKAIKLARELNVIPPDYITEGVVYRK